uniref:MICAL like 1 n=2 Tax=Leptobrachium leishanense TaxID=445787 RepID=A0A8C5PYH1_9ANUR
MCLAPLALPVLGVAQGEAEPQGSSRHRPWKSARQSGSDSGNPPGPEQGAQINKTHHGAVTDSGPVRQSQIHPGAMSASQALQQWCAQQCQGYPGVLVCDLSASFRDGLAFCALIHRHRPDLIDFDSLSKENVFENNHLAFQLAEHELGIPALLDPEDMVSMQIPDRLSIMTYVSQYYNHFQNSKAGTPHLRQTSMSEPSLKTLSEETLPKHTIDVTSSSSVSLSSTCALCQQHVHLVQRYMADGKLYHRQCFRCKECSSTLLPGSYRPGADSGTFVCTHHHRPRLGTGTSPDSGQENTVQKTAAHHTPKPHTPPKPPLPNKPQKDPDPETTPEVRPVPAPRRSDAIPQPLPRSRTPSDRSPARPTSLLNGNSQTPLPPVPKPRGRPRSSDRGEEGTKPKDPPWIALVAAAEPKRRAAPPPPPLAQKQGVEESNKAKEDTDRQSPSSKPTAYNPFDDEEEEEENGLNEDSLKPSHPWYGITPTSSPKLRKRPAPKVPNASPLAGLSDRLTSRLSYSEPPSSSPSPALSTESLPTEASVRNHKPEAVPKSSSEPTIHSPTRHTPPDVESPPFLNVPSVCPVSNDLSANTSLSSSSDLVSATEAPGSLSPGRGSSSESLRTSPSRPAPPPPRVSSPDPAEGASLSPDVKHPAKSMCKENPFNRKSSPITSPTRKGSERGPKPARPPAPGHGFPLIKRKVQADDYIPEDEIQMEMEEIEVRLDEMERRGVLLEQRLRKLENQSDEDSLLVEWFKLIQEKHTLVRRESELVYTSKQQSLEQRQADVEYELRCLLNKPEKDWIDEDKEREQVLMQELVTLIEQRNAIVKCLDEDRQREEEEDKVLEAMIQKKDFHTEPHKKRKGKFKPMKVLKLLSPKQESKSKSPKQKNREPPAETKRNSKKKCGN